MHRALGAMTFSVTPVLRFVQYMHTTHCNLAWCILLQALGIQAYTKFCVDANLLRYAWKTCQRPHVAARRLSQLAGCKPFRKSNQTKSRWLAVPDFGPTVHGHSGACVQQTDAALRAEDVSITMLQSSNEVAVRTATSPREASPSEEWQELSPDGCDTCPSYMLLGAGSS